MKRTLFQTLSIAATLVWLASAPIPAAHAQQAQSERCGVQTGSLQNAGEASRLRQELRNYVLARICRGESPSCPQWAPQGALLCGDQANWGNPDGEGYWRMDTNVYVNGTSGAVYRLAWAVRRQPT